MIDALGRALKAVERNRDLPMSPGAPLPPIQELVTRMTYDIRGNVLTITDALGREAFHSQIYDNANRKLSFISIDAGQRKVVLDAAGSVIEQWDSKGALILHGYDNLNRPLRLWARDGEGQKVTLRERLEYGDAGSPNQPAAERATNRAANRLGRPLRHFDEAGLLSFEAYDFKGNLLEKTRRVVSDAAIFGAFAGPPPVWRVEAFRVDWTNPATVPLDTTTFASTVSYDALSRVKGITYPQDVENERRQLRPHYNRAGALERVVVDDDIFVERIAYNAKGQRVLIAYGNGIMTRHAYDPHTFRLLRLRTERYTKLSERTYRHTGEPQQELAYEFDLVGNLTAIHDQTPGCGLPVTPDRLDRTFTYDALDRLRSATGRECDQPPQVPWDDTPRCSDLTKTRSYTEQYIYDLAGNIKQLKHLAGGTGFNRDFDLVSGNNRLNKLNVGATDFDYQYDANGNMTRETTSRHFEWDHADRMRVYRTQTNASEPTAHAHYLYDAGGQRVKKLVRKQGGQMEITLYIDGIFEYQRIVRGGLIEENNTLHVMDNQSRIALVRVGNAFSNDTTPAVKYHLGDHLGSSNLVLDGTGNLVNREEYTPYGETSFGSFARKRYRFTGKERDEESGLNYHRARYFAAHLGRWTSCDPISLAGGINLYRYVSNNPIKNIDSTGTQESNAHTSSQPSSQPQLHTLDDALSHLARTPSNCAITNHDLSKFDEPAPPGTPPEEPKHPLRVDVSGKVMDSAKRQWNAPNATVGTKAAIAYSVGMMSPLYALELTLNIPDLLETGGEHLALAYFDRSHQGHHLTMGGTKIVEGVLALAPLKGLGAGARAALPEGVASRMRVAARGGLDIEPATMFREIKHGEKFMDIWNEVHDLSQQTNREFALVRTTSGTRAIVYGGL